MEVGKLAHSHSQPGGMDRTPPGTPKKGGKMLAVRVQMLDDTVTMFQVQAKALGRVLFDQVCNQLNLLESDYFGLEYQEAGGTKYWLDLEKPICRQIGLSLVDTLVRFCVKFYTPDPSQLEEEFTRYLFCLQIKRDLSQGLLQCNSNTAALMASYIVQAECGDYVVEDYPDHRYLSSYKFVPNQDQELERRIMENHKKHAGQTPAEADLNLLETARRCELYGIKMHPAKDHEGCPLNLAVAHMGIVVFQNFSKINTFSWAKIRKISFKRKRFLVKLHPEGYGYYKDTVEFFFEGRNECKNFWKKCVENHGFFRCTMVKKVPRQKTRVLSRGSSFRYSGRTQKQIVDFVRENYVKRQTFQRSQSFRHSSSAHSSVANVGTSISAHPLLPLGDNAVAGTPASLSCGSMTLTSSPVHTADIHAGASPSPPLTTSVSPGTSVTSSPQHFYPQETPYRRAGHRLTKMKRPPARSHHAISPLLSPTDAATAASNRSANHSNNVANATNDAMSPRSSIKSPEFIDFNDIYSNCYTSLRSLANDAGNKVGSDEAKTDIFGDFTNSISKSNDSIGSKKPLYPEEEIDADRCTWHRSSSCKELYYESNAEVINNEGKNGLEGSEPNYELGAVSPVALYDKSRRKCYSAVTSKNPSIDRSGVVGSEMRIFSSSYPGTMSSLSTESAEGDERMVQVLDVKYDSQEEIALSHDDVSHDSYELLERELDDYHDGSSRSKRSRIVGDQTGERTRSCSWGSDRGVSPLDFRSSDNVVGFDVGGEESFWSLEKERNLKHKSEIDFRSFNNKKTKSSRQGAYKLEGVAYDGVERNGRTLEFLDYDNRFGERSRETYVDFLDTRSRKTQLEKRILGSKGFGDLESSKGFCPEVKLRKTNRDEKENFENFDRKRSQNRRKSFEELAGFDYLESGRAEDRKRSEKRREKKEREERFHEGLKEKEQMEWEREKERRQMDRRKSIEEKDLREKVEYSRINKSNDYANFQEINFKKFDRVVSNQFGKYPEFLPTDKSYEFIAQEKKVMENYEKVCQVSKLAKELNESEKSLTEKTQESNQRLNKRNLKNLEGSTDWKNVVVYSPKLSRSQVERTKSDPYSGPKSQKGNLLMHQKSIDLTSQQSEETVSDYDTEDGFKKGSKSEHDIPYVLHKRQCMNGTAKNADVAFEKMDLKITSPFTPEISSTESVENTFLEEIALLKQKAGKKTGDSKKSAVQIINLDLKDSKTPINILDSKKTLKSPKPPTGKSSTLSETKPTTPKSGVKKEIKKLEHPGVVKVKKSEKISKTRVEAKDNEEPIYAEVCTEVIEIEKKLPLEIRSPPEPPKRSSSIVQKLEVEEKTEKRVNESPPCEKRETITSKTKVLKPPEAKGRDEKTTSTSEGSKPEPAKKPSKVGEGTKPQPVSSRGKQDASFSSSLHQRREESLTLFARTRLGLSEGSAFAPILRQSRIGSPTSQRRAKSLDAPYVSVHSLPPADAFSSKDDTVDGNESDIVDPAVAKFEEFCKGEAKKGWCVKDGVLEPAFEVLGNTESEVDSVFTDDVEINTNLRKVVESQSKVEMYPEEKVLDAVRGKRLLSKIESVDFIDSEGDSSKLAEPTPIPSDRLVNLPESIRFPSVRQISGQTSEESADGWDPREVKVKRRTPRRSVGREEQETRESVVWDSKDEEHPDDEVWDDSLPAAGKYDGVVVNIGLPTEYLKRGSCGQSIDDDNLSTPMKESSPEHWVSVDDLPEALEREEKLLKKQEKILREKILNEKLKRELNLDTIDVDERYGDYKHSRYEEDSGSLKESCFKGHSLDTYELNEKKLREKGGNKNSSLDEELLSNKLISSYGGIEKDKHILKTSNYMNRLDYLQCKVVKDVTEIDQFGDNDEEFEEFFVVLDENLGKEGKSMFWDEEDPFRRTLSNDESLISVPEEFKDSEKEDDGSRIVKGGVEIRLPDSEGEKNFKEKDQISIQLHEKLRSLGEEEKPSDGNENVDDVKSGGVVDVGRLSPFSGSRRGSEENRKLSLTEDTGRLSPYDNSSRRSSDDPRRFSASEDVGRLSPFNDSRRGSEDPRRLSTSEDSRKCSVSESVSEETRRRLSSTEETRRKRASLTKQCSVGADSLSDEVISGIQECSSSFEHDERDVFESEPPNAVEPHVPDVKTIEDFPKETLKKPSSGDKETSLEIEVSVIDTDIAETEKITASEGSHLAPPTTERELSRETEDSVDYEEEGFKDMRETVKEKDISDGLICDNDFAQVEKKPRSSFEQSESSEGDELRYIDDKRGSTPEILMGKSKESVAVSIVVVNEGLSVLNKLKGKDGSGDHIKSLTLPRAEENFVRDEDRHTLPKAVTKPKPLTPKPVDYLHRKLTKNVPDNLKLKTSFPLGKETANKDSSNLLKSSLDSSQESDLDKMCDLSLVSHVQSQIARRNLHEAGKCLQRDELAVKNEARKTSSGDDQLLLSQKTSSEEKESSSFDLKSSTDEGPGGDDIKLKEPREKKTHLRSGFESSKGKREGVVGVGKEKRSPDQEKRDSGEDGSSSSSAPLHPKRELSSTWKPFLLESSGSSSLEEGWLPPDENAHLADEEETSSTSNNQQDDSYHDDVDYPTGIGYPVHSVSSAEMMVGGYGSIYALSRTLSRISERSTSEQERSDIEDDITKPSSHSASVEEESILSSDHQPSLSSDPPSPKESASAIPDLPVDKVPQFFDTPEEKTIVEPFGDLIPPPLPEEDWPSPPSSFSVADTPVVSHVETFYMEIHAEEACKVVVAEPREEGNSSSDENQTLQEESEFLHLSSDMSASTTTTTQDGTVVIPVRPSTGRTSSISEDTSMISEWSSSISGKSRPNDGSEDITERSKPCRQDRQVAVRDAHQNETSTWSPAKYCAEGYFDQDSPKPKLPMKIKPLKLSSPTGKTFGFFETPVSKVRSPTSQVKFFEGGERGGSGQSSLRSPTSYSETTSPQSSKRFSYSPGTPISSSGGSERRASKSPTKGKPGQRGVCTPYYSNVAESAEKSYFGRYDTGSLERTRIQSSRKCSSYYSVSKTAQHEGDSSNSDGPPAPSPNTIPRAAKKTKKRHRVAMDIVVRDGKIVAPPKTKATVVENSDSDKSSPRGHRKKQSDV